SVRPNWDDRYVTGGLLERYDQHTNKYYAVQKGAGFLVSERDVVAVQAAIIPEGGVINGFEFLQTSVEGDPDNSGRVRATITCAGWSIVPRGDDLEFVYVNKMNPNGKIPSSLVSKIVEGLPTIPAKVIHFIQSSGHPPLILTSSLWSQLRTEIFDLKAKTHTIKLISSNQDEELAIAVDPKPFGGSWKIEILGGSNTSAEKKTSTSAAVRVPAESGKVEIRITAA
ncbi:hypothetical protein FRC09_016325, partial [Ceratobasidium sp. 395]